jgi:type II secretory pathway predicted ATPase ExeA
MWHSYWNLGHDPFADRPSTWVPLSGHQEAVARLVDAVDAGRRWGLLSGPPGAGKTRVLHRTLSELRRPTRRFAMASCPIDGALLYARLAEGLGSRLRGDSSQEMAWRALEHAVRLCAVQHQHVVLAVDAAEALRGDPDREDLLRLGRLGESQAGVLTILVATGDDEAMTGQADGPWSPTVRLRPLLASEAGQYLQEKLASAGCRDALFSPRAVIRLHLHSGGTPGGLDRLASHCLMVAAARNLEAVSSELVDSMIGESQWARFAPGLSIAAE